MRMYVTLLLENSLLLFSETLQLVRAFKRDKNVPRAFLIIFDVLFILVKNCSELAFLAPNSQNGGFLVSRRSRWRPKDSRPSVRPSVRHAVA